MKSLVTGILGVLSGLLLSAAILFFVLPEKGEPIRIVTLTPATVVCDVGGAIREPGIYVLPYSARVSDAVNAAGGLLTDADASSLNLAATVVDGQKIWIPSHQTPIGTALPVARQDSLVNINTANSADLALLPGIGESKAQEIIAYREEFGPFLNKRDILNVSGIGESIFDKIEALITVQ